MTIACQNEVPIGLVHGRVQLLIHIAKPIPQTWLLALLKIKIVKLWFFSSFIDCLGGPELHQAMRALSPHAVLLRPAWSTRSDTIHPSVLPSFFWWRCLRVLCQAEWLNEHALLLTKYVLSHLGNKKKKSGINAAPVQVQQFVQHYKMLL